MSDFRGPPDLTDPAQLAAELDSVAGSLDVQAMAADGNTALGGHPYPMQFFQNAARAARAAAEFVRARSQPPAEPATPGVPVPTPEPKPVPKKDR